MTTDDTIREISQQIGGLLEAGVRAKEDRATIAETLRDGFERVQRQLDPLVSLPAQFEQHERQDAMQFAQLSGQSTKNHADNTIRLDDFNASLESMNTRLLSMEGWHNRNAGARGLAKYLIGIAIGVAGVIVAWLTAK
jgi:hypothetical protein